MKSELEKIRNWAQQKLNAGNEPPWAWYQYMKLTETLDAIIQGMNATTTENSQQSAPHRGSNLRLVGGKCSQDTAQPNPDIVKVQMPM